MAIINVDDAYILNETGAQVDKTTGIPFKNESLTDAEAAQARTNIRAGGSNENLLDNTYFVGGGSQLGHGKFPINQRGATSYTGGVRMIDRWVGQNGAGTMTLYSDGIMFTNASPGYGYVRHTLTRATQTTGWTLSVIADGVLYTSSDGTGITLPSGLLIYWASSNALSIRIPGSLNASEKISYIKYEAAPYSTALNDGPPDFVTEQLKCFSCYLNTATNNVYRAFTNGAGTSIGMVIELPVPMRPITALRGSLAWVREGGTDRSATIPSLPSIQSPTEVLIDLVGTCGSRTWVAVMGSFELDTGI